MQKLKDLFVNGRKAMVMAGAAVSAGTLSMAAAAQTGGDALTDGVTTGLSGGSDEVKVIGGAILAVAAIVVLIRYLRSAAR